MELSQFTRNPDQVKAALEHSEQMTLAKKRCYLYVPKRFHSKSLLSIGEEIYTCGIFMLSTEDNNYSVSLAATMVKIAPTEMNEVEINDQPMFEFVFEPGDAVVASNQVVKDDKILFYIFDEIIANGKVPVFMNYLDLGRIFDSSKTFTGVQMTATPSIQHALVTMIARDPSDPTQYFRQTSNGQDLDSYKPISMRFSIYGATNTTARMVGSNFNDSIDSALLRKSDRVEPIEELLRQ